MGRMLGAFADDSELDRPDLNKCPDCGCFFEDDNCPICGKRCPEEMRAGNRKPVKKSRPKKSGGHYRLASVEWYHRWWFIILILIPFPIIGIILLLTSPHKKGAKIAVFTVAIVYTILSSIGIGSVVQSLVNLWSDPVDTSLSRADYVAACEAVEAEDYFRYAESYQERFVSVELTVKERFVDMDGYYQNEEYTTYYICEAIDGSTVEIMIRDCFQKDDVQNLSVGAMIRVYGEAAGNVTVYDMDGINRFAPCIYAAYVDLIG